MDIALKRVISTPLLVLYGMGNILGAGIYVLVGKVAGASGYAAPYAFVVAAIVAGFTGLSYAKLSSHYPFIAGAASYALVAFKHKALAGLVGLGIIFSGLVSSSAILHGFAAYFDTFFILPHAFTMGIALVILSLVAAIGIKESLWAAALMTTIEVFGLVYVIWVAWPDATLAIKTFELANDASLVLGWVIFSGAFLAFYAYLGFEDVVNIAEEVKTPSVTMPRSLIIALVVTTIIYIIVSFIAVAQVDPARLATTDAPLALIFSEVSGKEPYVISIVALFAVLNGALVNLIMSSRVVYGMAKTGIFPKPLSVVNRRTQTPVNATLLIGVLILVVAWLLPLEVLAKVTSFVLLIIFIVVNAAYFKLVWQGDIGSRKQAWIPVCGLLSCIALLGIPVFIL